jgi:hypothetical protein
MLTQKSNTKRVIWLSIVLLIIVVATVYTFVNGGIFGPSVSAPEELITVSNTSSAISTKFDTKVLEQLKSFKQWVNENILEVNPPQPKDNPFVPPVLIAPNQGNINTAPSRR